MRTGFFIAGVVLIPFGAGVFIVSVRRRRTVGAENVKEGLLTAGSYRFTRHPIYTGIGSASIGLALALGTWDGLLMVPLVFLVNAAEAVIEELVDIGARFPAEYAEYRKQTGMVGPPVPWAAFLVFLAGLAFAGSVSSGAETGGRTRPEGAMSVLVEFLRWTCGVSALALLAYLLGSVLRAAKRPTGTESGRQVSWLHSPLFYAAASAFFFGVCFRAWIPLPGAPYPDTVAVIGALVCFPGLAFVLWGRLALGGMYFVSTGFGAQLFAEHRLITNGPFAIVRHPMYSGLILAAFGSLLLYQTWTGAFLMLCSLSVLRRARREEEALAKAFGAEWAEYRSRVPMLVPRPPARRGSGGPDRD